MQLEELQSQQPAGIRLACRRATTGLHLMISFCLQHPAGPPNPLDQNLLFVVWLLLGSRKLGVGRKAGHTGGGGSSVKTTYKSPCCHACEQRQQQKEKRKTTAISSQVSTYKRSETFKLQMVRR
jgi:hypothetical protein